MSRAVRIRAATLALAALAGSASLAGVAHADPPRAAAAKPSDAEVQKALARFKRGQDLYTERNFAGALVEFRKAYETAPSFRVLYNIGQVCYQMQDYVCAYRSLEQYLADGASQIPAARRAAVSEELASLKQRIGNLDVRSNVAGAELSVDDALVGTLPLSAPVQASAGRHKIVVVAPGRTPMTRTVDVAGQDTLQVDIPFPELPRAEPEPKPAAPVAPPRETPAAREASRMTTLSWVGYGVGALALVGGGVTGALALGAADDVKSKVYPDESAAASDRSRAGTLALASDVLLVSGVVAVAATTVLTFLVPRGGPPARASAPPGAFTF